MAEKFYDIGSTKVELPLERPLMPIVKFSNPEAFREYTNRFMEHVNNSEDGYWEDLVKLKESPLDGRVLRGIDLAFDAQIIPESETSRIGLHTALGTNLNAENFMYGLGFNRPDPLDTDDFFASEENSLVIPGDIWKNIYFPHKFDCSNTTSKRMKQYENKVNTAIKTFYDFYGVNGLEKELDFDFEKIPEIQRVLQRKKFK